MENSQRNEEWLVKQGGVTQARTVGRASTAVKVLTRWNFTLTFDLKRLCGLDDHFLIQWVLSFAVTYTS